MLAGQRVIVILPAYNAARTLERTYAEIPHDVVDEVILTDDASADGTVALAARLGIRTLSHERNRGYGANQRTCYAEALRRGADIVVMLHPDYQYSPRLVTAMASMIASGHYDVVLGSRILGRGALAGGMPRYKYLANRVLTFLENIALGLKLSEYHTGYRAFSAAVLRALPLDRLSDDFVFDNQMLAQAAFANFHIGEISCPTRYFAEASSISFARSVRYGCGVLRTAMAFRLARWRGNQELLFVNKKAPRLRKQKNFVNLSHSHLRRYRPWPSLTKVFWFFFSKKNLFLACLLILFAFSINAPHSIAHAFMREAAALRARGPFGVALFTALVAGLALVGVVPGALLGVAAGAVYGIGLGFVTSALGILAAALAAFGLSRSLLRPLIAAALGRHARLAAFDARVTRDRWRIVFLLRISPVMPFSLTSYALGLSGIALGDYSLGTLAALPPLFGYVLIGAWGGAVFVPAAPAAALIHDGLALAGIAGTLALTLRLTRLLRAGPV